ncbi:MAP3K12-binding inhibitory protein 1 isoform X2 [Eublepharis macularius]|uniref:MAP3K12-binding inhibitory protein 1 isoform X2 n=1 Tax=Eublepharis macularius TaxID=481883 RepID=A0AA97J0B2_EUBMA|nr:MAP3K12-binding inhibitory protein 1-like isoform X2 [Eublepharis macularius]XP_054828983.1 MAP3K12-binding inhibitory protein 1 isoform X2 [Eublepharis macularius]
MASVAGAGELGSAAPIVSGDPTEKATLDILEGSLRSLPRLVGQLNLGEDVKINIDWNKFQHTAPLQPMLLFNALQQHILDLQPFIEKLQSLIKERTTIPTDDSSKTEGRKCETNSNVTEGDVQMEVKDTACGSVSPKETYVDLDPEVVQIKARKAEIDRRISAFMERKQAEINENNVREFCNVIDCNQENSCARTDAVFTPYPGFKSHIKVSRVVNTYGPQTRNEVAHGSSHKANTLLRDCGNQAIEERLQNIEAHLRLHMGGPVPKDIYQRIKKLEDKILELEGMSPEYFQSVVKFIWQKKEKPTESKLFFG